MKLVSYWMMSIAVIHCSLSLALYGQTYLQFFGNGLFAVVTDDLDRLALWFFVAGVLMFLIGYLFRLTPHIPKPIGVILGGVSILGGILMPASGFWLLLPPAVGIILTKQA